MDRNYACCGRVDEISLADLQDIHGIKHGDSVPLGPAPLRRSRFGYYPPGYYYEALINNAVTAQTKWLDVGAGRDIFPNNPNLSRILSERCSLLVGVDPSDNIGQNPYLHERAQCLLPEYKSNQRFDLITLRMVAEHVENPTSLIESLRTFIAPGGLIVIFTVNMWSPISLVSRTVPFKLHYLIKRAFWGSKKENTFPVAYRMNTRRALKRLFETAGFEERYFRYLDDCCTFSRFHYLNYVELAVWRAFQSLALRYPENCLLAAYQTKDR